MSDWYNKAAQCLDDDLAEGLLTEQEYNTEQRNLRAELEEQLDWEREQRMEEYCGY